MENIDAAKDEVITLSKEEQIINDNYASIIKQLEDINLITRTGC